MQKISDYKWLLPRSFRAGMKVEGIIYGDKEIIDKAKEDKALEQVANVAFLPGIVKYSLAMPDIHWGYGFCIGGVAATDIEKGGVISPGGVGFDINCGVRLMRTNLTYKDIKTKIPSLVEALYRNIPVGVGSSGKIKLNSQQEKEVMLRGAEWAVELGWGVESDLECCEERGSWKGALPEEVSPRAYERGRNQLGTLGSGNHFVEIQEVEEIYKPKEAETLGIFPGQITLMIHSGSRGFGYQICDDFIKIMLEAAKKYHIYLPDRQLACAPVESKEAQRYIGAMKAAANYAWCNRQILMHLARESFSQVFGAAWSSLGMELIYDVAHNIAKFEDYEIEGNKKKLCVHRKGATRALGPDNTLLPPRYRSLGQPVIIPGDMGTASYLLLGTKKAEAESFSSTCHGAGRVMSRHKALKNISYNVLMGELKEKGIVAMAKGRKTMVEEAPAVYKSIDTVIETVEKAGLSQKVCRMRPVGVIKG